MSQPVPSDRSLDTRRCECELPHADVKGFEPHICDLDYSVTPKKLVIKSNWRPPVYDAKVRPELEGK